MENGLKHLNLGHNKLKIKLTISNTQDHFMFNIMSLENISPK